MRFAALFLDSVTPSGLDAELTRAHFEYLMRHSSLITMAGGLRPPEGGGFCGSLWVIEAKDEAEAHRLVEEDPYCLAGLRPDRKLFRWGEAPKQSVA